MPHPAFDGEHPGEGQVASARRHVSAAAKADLGKEGLLCTGFIDDDVFASDEDDLLMLPAAKGRFPRHGHC